MRVWHELVCLVDDCGELQSLVTVTVHDLLKSAAGEVTAENSEDPRTVQRADAEVRDAPTTDGQQQD